VRFPTPEICRKDRSLTASDTKTRSLKPDGACQIEYRLIHRILQSARGRLLGWQRLASRWGSVIPRAIGHRRALAGFPSVSSSLATTTSPLCLLRLSRRHDGLDVAEVLWRRHGHALLASRSPIAARSSLHPQYGQRNRPTRTLDHSWRTVIFHC
jgi:hypothetical protein